MSISFLSFPLRGKVMTMDFIESVQDVSFVKIDISEATLLCVTAIILTDYLVTTLIIID